MRNDAREAALCVIFSQQFNEECSDTFKKGVMKNFKLDRESDILFSTELINCVNEHKSELLQKLDDACLHYHENRINPMDKSILLIALAEITYFDDIPPVVSASEATNLARKYSTDTSADFVNGVLAGVINVK